GVSSALGMRLRSFDEAKEWEEELRASELRKAMILDSSLDAIVTVDHEGRILEFNAAARRVFGYTRAELFGRDAFEKVVPPENRPGRPRAQTGVRADGRRDRPRPPPPGRGHARGRNDLPGRGRDLPGLGARQGAPHRLPARPHVREARGAPGRGPPRDHA